MASPLYHCATSSSFKSSRTAAPPQLSSSANLILFLPYVYSATASLMPQASANCSDSRKLRFGIPNRHPHQPGPNALVPAAGSRSSNRFTGRFPDLAFGRLLKQRCEKPTEISPLSLVAQDPLPLAAHGFVGSPAIVSSAPFCDQPKVLYMFQFKVVFQCSETERWGPMADSSEVPIWLNQRLNQ